MSRIQEKENGRVATALAGGSQNPQRARPVIQTSDDLHHALDGILTGILDDSIPDRKANAALRACEDIMDNAALPQRFSRSTSREVVFTDG